MNIISQGLLLIGGLFYLLGGLGVLRMPDTLNRIQAGTKATTLGALSIMFGLVFVHPEWGFKLGVIMVFIVMSNPIGSSVIARATYHTQKHRQLLKEDAYTRKDA